MKLKLANVKGHDFKFESPTAHERRLLNDPVAKKEWDAYTKQSKREKDKLTIIDILHNDPELFQEALAELRYLKLKNLI